MKDSELKASTGENIVSLYVEGLKKGMLREPFLSVHTKISLCAGFVDNGKKLIIKSLMPAHGTIFTDEIEVYHLKFNSGVIATIGIATEKAVMVVP